MNETATQTNPHQQMGNLDYFYLLNELNENLSEGWLNQVYDSTEGFRFKFRKQVEKNFVVQMGIRAHLVNSFSSAPALQTSFTKYLREMMQNTKLQSIEQVEFDRIIQFNFSTNKQGKKIVIEQFSQGNIIVLDEENKILRPMRAKDYSSRSLHHDLKYQPPVSTKIHPNNFTYESLQKDKIKEGSPITSVITHLVNIPPFYAQEAIQRSGLDQKTPSEQLSENQWKTVCENVRSLTSFKLSARIYYKNEESESNPTPIAFSPFELKKFEGLPGITFKEFETFSQALEEYYLPIWKDKIESQNNQSSTNALSKLNFTLNEQIKAKDKFSAQIEEGNLSGKWIMENSYIVQEIISKALELRKSGLKKAEMETELNKFAKSQGQEFSILVNSNRLSVIIDFKKKE